MENGIKLKDDTRECAILYKAISSIWKEGETLTILVGGVPVNMSLASEDEAKKVYEEICRNMGRG